MTVLFIAFFILKEDSHNRLRENSQNSINVKFTLLVYTKAVFFAEMKVGEWGNTRNVKTLCRLVYNVCFTPLVFLHYRFIFGLLVYIFKKRLN